MTVPNEADFDEPHAHFPIHSIAKYAYAMTLALQLHYNVNRQQLSYKTDISLAVISKILNGYLESVSIETISKLEAAVTVMMKERGIK